MKKYIGMSGLVVVILAISGSAVNAQPEEYDPYLQPLWSLRATQKKVPQELAQAQEKLAQAQKKLANVQFKELAKAQELEKMELAKAQMQEKDVQFVEGAEAPARTALTLEHRQARAALAGAQENEKAALIENMENECHDKCVIDYGVTDDMIPTEEF